MFLTEKRTKNIENKRLIPITKIIVRNSLFFVNNVTEKLSINDKKNNITILLFL
jgi:ABC-type iron transport system FetAB permease component